MTREELFAYFAEMTALANDPRRATEFICATMWKRFTPDAIARWTPSGVLEHIAECMAPPPEDEPDPLEDAWNAREPHPRDDP